MEKFKTASALFVQSIDWSAAVTATGEESVKIRSCRVPRTLRRSTSPRRRTSVTPMTWRESLQLSSELEVKRSSQNCPRIQLLRCLEHGRVQFPPSVIASLRSGEIQEDLEGVEIPENPDYEAYYDNYDYPRTYRMSKKIDRV